MLGRGDNIINSDGLPIVVVPDGLAVDWKTGKVLPRPSFVYRAVLDYIMHHFPLCLSYLAPANDFGCGVTEQKAAALYLNTRVSCVVPPSPIKGYIDTRGNAYWLRRYLENEALWPLPSVILVVAQYHARRAALCFKKEGFLIHDVVAVPYLIPVNEGVVGRLWYYRYPRLHRVYEFLALLRDICRSRAC